MRFIDRQGIPEALVPNRAAGDYGHGSPEEADKDKGRKGKEEDEEDEEEEAEEDKASALGCSEDDGFKEYLLVFKDYLFLSVGTDRTFEICMLM